MFKNSQPQLLNVSGKPSQPKRRREIALVFDEEKRREFLGGFRGGGLERGRKAQEQLQQQLRGEREKVGREARERYGKSLSGQVVPELRELLSQQEFDLGSHTVGILELSVADLEEGKGWMGENGIMEERGELENDKGNRGCGGDNGDGIVGVSLRERCGSRVQPGSKSNGRGMESAGELKQEIKKAALGRVKKSRAFRQKRRLEQQKNRKRDEQGLKARGLVHKRGKGSKSGSGR